MPIYEYECEACGNRHEVLQKVSDPKLIDCPSCGEPALKKLITAASFRLSGSGWYETDFKSDNKRNLATDDSQKKSDSKDSVKKETIKADKKAEGKSDSKTESKSKSAKKKTNTKTDTKPPKPAA